MITEKVYLAVISNKDYIPGIKALKKSLFKTNTKYKLTIMIPSAEESTLRFLLTKDKILDDKCQLLVKPNLEPVFPIDYKFKNHYWKYTLFKLQSMSCYQYKKIVLLDSDLLILKNIDDLFEKKHLSASIGDRANDLNKKPTGFNSGVVVLEPNEVDYKKITVTLDKVMKYYFNINYKVGDQDVFNNAFPNWIQNKDLILPETYNSFFYDIHKMCKAFSIRHKDIKIVHFTGEFKPWQKSFFSKKNLKYILSCLFHLRFFQLKTYVKYILYSH